MGADEAVAPADLPALALSRPREALARATELTSQTADATALSYARQAAGIVLRDSGRVADSLRELRAALRSAHASGNPDRLADVRATLGGSLVVAGRTKVGLAELDTAVLESSGSMLARVLMRRATVYLVLGRHDEGLSDMRKALAGIRASDDPVWEARALNNRANIHVARGALGRAEQDVRRAEQLFAGAGQELESVLAQQNLGVIAFCRGDLPSTLRLYEDADQRYRELATTWPDLAFDRSQAFLAAGLSDEAVAVVAETLHENELTPQTRAELLYVAAAASLATGDTETALDRARQARELFVRQDREWWAARADLVALRARVARGDSGARMTDLAGGLGERLEALRADEAPVALLLAGRLALAHRPEQARRYLRSAARYRNRSSASDLVHATGWLASALEKEMDHDARGVLTACGKGLDALDEHRSTLGSSELRALATGHGTDLAELALRQAVRSGGGRRLLVWSERWRATALVEPPVRPPRGSGVAGDLALLRTRTRLLDDARREGRDGAALARERAALESAVRARRHQASGVRRADRDRFEVTELIDALGDTTFVELVVVDETLHAVSVRNGRVTTRAVGPVAEADQALTAARFVLRQIARGRPGDLGGIGGRLQRTLLGEPGGPGLGEGPVVVSPPGRLHAVPWGLLPALAERPVTVVPSAAMWLRARAVARPTEPRMVLVSGPGLGTGGAEVDVLARSAPDAVLLRDGTATVEAGLAALDGASLVHVAAHGHFRSDSPMFSSLLLDDGPLTVHDLEALHRAPHRLVLSSCDSAVLAPVGADELLGLTSALLSLGTSGVVCSVAEVNDEAVVDVMLCLHRGLDDGLGPAEALLAARNEAGADPVRRSAAAAFVALGA